MLTLLDAALDSARQGQRRLVVVEGPSGIGKSSVLLETRSHAVETGIRVLHVRGNELERAFSYGVVRQLLEPLMERDATNRARLLAGAAAAADRLFEPDAAADAPRPGAG